MKEKLTDENFLIYCAKHYDNPQAISTQEFLEDLERIKYIKKERREIQFYCKSLY